MNRRNIEENIFALSWMILFGAIVLSVAFLFMLLTYAAIKLFVLPAMMSVWGMW